MTSSIAVEPQLQSSLAPAGPVAAVTAEMTWVLVLGATAVFLLVMVALALALSRRAHVPTRAANKWWWIAGLGFAFPLLVMTALLIYASLRTRELPQAEAPSAEGLVIAITGRLWWWDVRYSDPTRGIDFKTANQVHLPAGQLVTLRLSSADVIHSFWVPSLAGKVDMVPGRIHQLRLRADRPGVFRGQCAEFCGEQHARMALHVVAQSSEDFEQWLLAQSAPAAPPVDARARRGWDVFREQRCNACHVIRGSDPASGLGPDLTHVASRLYLGAGTLPMGPQSLRDWVAHTQQVKPGARMPSYELDADSMDALLAFMEQLR